MNRIAELIGITAGLIIWTAALHAAFTNTPLAPASQPRAATSSPESSQPMNVTKPLIPIKGDSLSVIGRVVDLDGNPVQGVSVFLREAKPTVSPEGKYQPVVTDRLGWFQFFNLNPGRYAFVAIQGHQQLSGVEIIPMLTHTSRLHVRIVLDMSSQVI